MGRDGFVLYHAVATEDCISLYALKLVQLLGTQLYLLVMWGGRKKEKKKTNNYYFCFVKQTR
jgi:hypothetical protein